MAVRADVAAASEQGEVRGCALGCGAVAERSEVRHHRSCQAANAWGVCRQRVKSGERSGRRVGFPRFKRRKHEQGFHADNGPDTVRGGKVVVLPKIGHVAMVEQLQFRGSIR